MKALIILLLLIPITQSFADNAREENDFTIRLFAERKGNSAEFTIDLPIFPQWVSYGPNFYFENFWDAQVIGTDFEMPLRTFGPSINKHEKITFRLPNAILKGLSLHLTYVVVGSADALTAAGRSGRRATAIANASTRHIPSALISSRDVRVMVFTLRAPDKDGANEIKPEQGGADQPATAPQLKSEGKEKPKPEAEVRPR